METLLQTTSSTTNEVQVTSNWAIELIFEINVVICHS